MGVVAKEIEVSCAIIERDGLVLVARRSPVMAQPLKWEFPGGKLQPGESPAASLKREILEELEVEIEIARALPESRYCYPDFTIILHPFICTIAEGVVRPVEHAEIAWLPPGRLPSLAWAAADRPVLEAYLEQLEGQECW